jgi:Zn-dependent M28 family amino/carboxypeptidase
VGANDGGSSAGLLLEMARILCRSRQRDEIRLVWLDGEEATRHQWMGEDNLYGSRRVASQWAGTGTARRVKAVINVDMIGDRHLVLLEEWNSTQWLRELVWRAAAEAGHGDHFPRNPGAIEDDHVPFLREGMPALDLIDFEYGPGNSWWHTDRDTTDKLSPNSFQVVGEVLLRAIQKLAAK